MFSFLGQALGVAALVLADGSLEGRLGDAHVADQVGVPEQVLRLLRSLRARERVQELLQGQQRRPDVCRTEFRSRHWLQVLCRAEFRSRHWLQAVE